MSDNNTILDWSDLPLVTSTSPHDIVANIDGDDYERCRITFRWEPKNANLAIELRVNDQLITAIPGANSHDKDPKGSPIVVERELRKGRQLDFKWNVELLSPTVYSFEVWLERGGSKETRALAKPRGKTVFPSTWTDSGTVKI